MISSSESSARKNVVIVGGGLAGLAAGDALVSAAPEHFNVTLLEAKRTFGGRAGSFTDSETGEAIDYCQHVAMGCCTNFLALLDRHGLADQMNRYDELRFLHPDHLPSRFAASKWLPPPLHLASTIGSLHYLTSQQKRQIRLGLWRLIRTPSASLFGVTASKWLRENGQTIETIKLFWDVVLVSALGEQTDRVAMSAARKVFVDGFAAAYGASDVCVPRKPLSQLIGNQLSQAIAASGVRLMTDCGVKRIDGDVGGPAMIETVDEGTFEADHVIAAVPWYRIASLFADRRMISSLPNLQRWTDFPMSSVTGLHLWFDRQIMTEPHAVMVGTVAQWLFRQPFVDSSMSTSTQDSQDSQDRYYYQVVISASQQTRAMSREQIVAVVCDELRNAFPAAMKATLLASRVVTDRRAVFSVCPDTERDRPRSSTALPWLHLAGDWIATGWPSTMEGAVIGGKMAAASVLTRERLPACPIDRGLKVGWLARRLIRDR